MYAFRRPSAGSAIVAPCPGPIAMAASGRATGLAEAKAGYWPLRHLGAIANTDGTMTVDAVIERTPVSKDGQAGRPSAPRAEHIVLLLSAGLGRTGLQALLAQAGLRSAWVGTAAAARAAFAHLRFDALLVDSASIAPDVPAGVAALRSWCRAPLFVVDAQATERGELDSLEHGASGYLPLSITPRLLRARLLATPTGGTEPAHADDEPGSGLPGGWQLDGATCALRRGATELPLTDLQWGVLQRLAQAPFSVATCADLAAALQPGEPPSVIRHISVYVHRLRRRLEAFGLTDFTIETVRQRGYRLRGHRG